MQFENSNFGVPLRLSFNIDIHLDVDCRKKRLELFSQPLNCKKVLHKFSQKVTDPFVGM